jgi:hypothetical protein
MEEQEENLIEVKEMKVNRLNMGQKSMDMTFGFHFQGKPTRMPRTYKFGDNTVNFVLAVVNDVKKLHDSKLQKEEEMKEKLVNHMSRLLQQVKDLEKYKEYSRYMREFNKIDCYKISFPEIEYNPAKRASERWA